MFEPLKIRNSLGNMADIR